MASLDAELVASVRPRSTATDSLSEHDDRLEAKPLPAADSAPTRPSLVPMLSTATLVEGEGGGGRGGGGGGGGGGTGDDVASLFARLQAKVLAEVAVGRELLGTQGVLDLLMAASSNA